MRMLFFTVFLALELAGCNQNGYYEEKLDLRNALLQCQASDRNVVGISSAQTAECEKLEDEYRRKYGACPRGD